MKIGIQMKMQKTKMFAFLVKTMVNMQNMKEETHFY